jgi:hypothetical protein
MIIRQKECFVMENDKAELFEAFRADHALLGRGFHILRERLAAGDIDGARAQARRIDEEAGAHIAFEEQDFYPALSRLLDEEEVTGMYREHHDGLKLILELSRENEAELGEDNRVRALLDQVDAMQAHVSECGELFGAMGGLSDQEIAALMDRLNFWRAQAPSWSDYARDKMR